MQQTLRTYHKNTKQYDLYKTQHETQSYQYVINKKKHYEDKIAVSTDYQTVAHVLSQMSLFVDDSDPDLPDTPNLVHAYQTAERIRKDHPLNYQFQVCGLIHDIGKILYQYNEPQWNVVGDTYVVGCEFPKSIVYYDTTFKNNPDIRDPILNSKYGIYKKHTGLSNLTLSFGHDEYLYMVLNDSKNNQLHNFSQKYMDMIRYHSFYPWHTSNEYTHLTKPEDVETLENVRNLNKYDLYSKEDSLIDISTEPTIKKYYDKLLNIYFPKSLCW
jgi:inositol oxygenase